MQPQIYTPTTLCDMHTAVQKGKKAAVLRKGGLNRDRSVELPQFCGASYEATISIRHYTTFQSQNVKRSHTENRTEIQKDKARGTH